MICVAFHLFVGGRQVSSPDRLQSEMKYLDTSLQRIDRYVGKMPPSNESGSTRIHKQTTSCMRNNRNYDYNVKHAS